jgi:predicted transposase YdaD
MMFDDATTARARHAKSLLLRSALTNETHRGTIRGFSVWRFDKDGPMRDDKDRSGKWMIGHFGDAILRLAGVQGFNSWRAAAAEVVQPKQLPDGLLEVLFPGRTDADPFLLEIATYPERRVYDQVMRDALLIWLDRRVLPEIVTIVLRPKGRLRVAGRQRWTSRHGLTAVSFAWRVIELWTLPADELLSANDVGLIPWLPLTEFDTAPEVLLQQCRERIDRDAPKELRENLLAVTQVMTKLRYNDRGLLAILGGQKVMIESPLIREIVAEATAKAEVRSKREALLAFLRARFGPLPRELRADLKAITDRRTLTELVTLAGKCSDLKEFQSAVSPER